MVFKDREEAAILLARALKNYAGKKNTIVVAIPRGGVVVGRHIAKDLGLPLDISINMKIHHPENLEVAIGSVGSDVTYVDKKALEMYGIPDEYVDERVKELKTVIKSRQEKYRKNSPPAKLSNKTVILVDDGLATGHTMLAAIKSAKKQKAKKIIVAIPVAPPATVKLLKKVVDEIICLMIPENFIAISQFYSDFRQVDDNEIMDLLSPFFSNKKKKK